MVMHLASPWTTRTSDKQRHRSTGSKTSNSRTANYSSMQSSWRRGSKNNNRTPRGVC
jgi:hypothetical protein